MQKLCLPVLFALCLVALSSFSPAQNESPAPAAPPEHVLVGAWQASDGTVFIFRKDGTFHGYDFRKREIWGNWVTLSPSRIGFQSLLHDSFYRPQYAIIDKADKDTMNYIVTGGTTFIEATRLEVAKAEADVEAVVQPQIHQPGEDQND